MAATSGVITGQVERTQRGFRQDTELAMGRDPVRAIVELVTNADDAYVGMQPRRKGPIRIEIQRGRNRPSTITVKDRARGMTHDQMLERLGKEAQRTSGFETGDDVRGLLGRGAKDCSQFGTIEWTSVFSGRGASFRLTPSGGYQLTDTGPTGPREAGTTASLTLERRFPVHTHGKLKELLERHYALRPCLADREGREVKLVDVGQNREDHLVYEPPVGHQVQRAIIQVPGYPGETAELDLKRSAQFLDDNQERTYWRHGLVVTSGRAAYDVFGGKFEREPWSQYLGWFFGTLRADGIARLIREYDDCLDRGEEPPDSNPIRLVTRDRRGLVGRSEHPFLQALYQSAEEFIEPYLQALRDELEGGRKAAAVGEELAGRLKELGKVIGEIFREEEEQSEQSDGGSTTDVPEGLSVIPDVRVVRPGSHARFSIRYRPPSTVAAGWPVPTANISVIGGEGEVDKGPIPLSDRGIHFTKDFSVRDLPEGSIAEIQVEVEGLTTNCFAESRTPALPAEIQHLQFEHATYRLKPTERRRLVLLCPWDLVVGNEPATFVGRGGSALTIEPASQWAFDEDRQCGVMVVIVRMRRIGEAARIVASHAGQDAEARLSVVGVSSPSVQVALTDEQLPQRAVWADETLKVAANDRSISRYLGPASKNWPGQESIHFRTALAEIVAFHCVRRILDNRPRSGRALAVNDLYRAHMQLEQKYLPKIHGVMVRKGEIFREP